MILAALAAAAIAAPGIQKDLQAPVGLQPRPQVLRELKAGPQPYPAPSVLPVQPEGSGVLKHLRLSPRRMPDAAHPGAGLDRDLRIAPTVPLDPPSPSGVTPVRAMLGPSAERLALNRYLPERCKDAPIKAVDRNGRPRPRKLTDLPNGALMLAVDRRIDGCPILTIIYGDVAPETEGPTILRAEPLSRFLKREDAPSSRR